MVVLAVRDRRHGVHERHRPVVVREAECLLDPVVRRASSPAGRRAGSPSSPSSSCGAFGRQCIASQRARAVVRSACACIDVPPSQRDAHGRRRMRVVERGIQRIRRERRGVVLVELHQRADERRGRRVLRGERVGLELVPARVQRRERRQHEREHRQHEEEQDQRHAGAVHRRAARRGLRRTTATRRATRGAREGERRRGHPQHALQHVLQLEVAELVREHGLDLVRRQALEQRVEEHDALRAAESGEERVAVARAARAVHHEQAAVGETAAREQRLDRVARRACGQRRELVEERRDHVG